VAELTDLASVIEGAQRKEPEAFDVLVDTYSARLHGFLYRLTGSREDAEDLVQDVFVRVVRTIGSYEHRDRFEPWLFRIATNLARDRVRRIRRAPETASLDGAGEGDGGDETGRRPVSDPAGRLPEQRLQRAENADRLQQAIQRLPEGERVVILLRHYAQMSFARIAEAMDVPLGTALARAHRGLGKLRTWMESEA